MRTAEAWQRGGYYEGRRRVAPDGQVPIAVLFDLLFLDGQSLESLPYTERHLLLEGLELNNSS
jgi:ATP-dependent DNA ligase